MKQGNARNAVDRGITRRSFVTRAGMAFAGASALGLGLGSCASPEASGADVTTANNVELNTIIDKIDSEYAYNLIYECSKLGNDGNDLGFRCAGSTGEKKCADRLEQEMRDIGLKEVTVDTYPVDAWEFTSASLTLGEKTVQLGAFCGSVGTPKEGIKAELIDIKEATHKDYEGLEVSGKILIAEFNNDDYWFSAPQYEAELAGAAALIVCAGGESYNMKTDSFLAFDGALRDTIPVLSISRDDIAYLREKLAEGQQEVVLKAEITLDKENGRSQSIWGLIPGKNPAFNIMVGAHYDGYFHSFQDDLWGCGVNLSVAKAMVETGYVPEYNVVFIVHGSEEYGVVNTHYDWCQGAYQMINNVHPEWADTTIAYLENDTVRPDAEVFNIASTPEFHSFFAEYMQADMGTPPSDPYVEGAELLGWNGPWSEDFEFNIAGAPSVQCGKAASEWKLYAYHTKYDDESAWQENVFSWVSSQYASWIYRMNTVAIVPLDFSTVAREISDSLDTEAIADTPTQTRLERAIQTFEPIAKTHYEAVEKANLLYQEMLSSDAVEEEELSTFKARLAEETIHSLRAFRVVERDILRLDVWDTVVYPHQIISYNHASLTACMDALKLNDGELALSKLIEVDTGYLAARFSKTVYEYVGIYELDPTRDDLWWGTHKTLPQVNVWDAYAAIAAKLEAGSSDFGEEIAMVEKLQTQEKEIALRALGNEAALLERVSTMLSLSHIGEIVEDMQNA